MEGSPTTAEDDAVANAYTRDDSALKRLLGDATSPQDKYYDAVRCMPEGLPQPPPGVALRPGESSVVPDLTCRRFHDLFVVPPNATSNSTAITKEVGEHIEDVLDAMYKTDCCYATWAHFLASRVRGMVRVIVGGKDKLHYLGPKHIEMRDELLVRMELSAHRNAYDGRTHKHHDLMKQLRETVEKLMNTSARTHDARYLDYWVALYLAEIYRVLNL